MQYATLPTQEYLSRLSGRTGAFGLASVEQQQRQAEINAAMQKFAEEYRITDPENMNILMQLLGLGFGKSASSGWGMNIGLPAPEEGWY